MSPGNLGAAVSLAADLLNAAQKINTRLLQVSTVIQRAHFQGRDLTGEELDAIRATDDQARERLQKLIDGA